MNFIFAVLFFLLLVSAGLSMRGVSEAETWFEAAMFVALAVVGLSAAAVLLWSALPS